MPVLQKGGDRVQRNTQLAHRRKGERARSRRAARNSYTAFRSTSDTLWGPKDLSVGKRKRAQGENSTASENIAPEGKKGKFRALARGLFDFKVSRLKKRAG